MTLIKTTAEKIVKKLYIDTGYINKATNHEKRARTEVESLLTEFSKEILGKEGKEEEFEKKEMMIRAQERASAEQRMTVYKATVLEVIEELKKKLGLYNTERYE